MAKGRKTGGRVKGVPNKFSAKRAAAMEEVAIKIGEAETYDADTPIQLALHDYLLPGRGVNRVESLCDPAQRRRPGDVPCRRNRTILERAP